MHWKYLQRSIYESRFLWLLILIVLLPAVKRDTEFQTDLHFLFQASSSGKLVVENYLRFQKMRYDDKIRKSQLEQNASETKQIMI